MSVDASTEKKSFQATQYYNHKFYVNVYYAMYKSLEKWITKNIFRNDPSRVFLASDDYAYRRRFELTDTSKDFDTLDFSSLRFPFANYWPQNVGWTPDTRIAAKQAALSYVGIYVGNTKVRAASAILPIEVTFYFDREDDARLAYDTLYFYSFNEHYYKTSVSYGVDTTRKDLISPILEIPANITLTNLKFNPQFKETDWLKKQRVFPIKCTFEMRSYVIAPPTQKDFNAADTNDYDYNDNADFFYIVDDVILNMSNKEITVKTYDAGYDVTSNSFKGSTPFPDEGELGVLYVDDNIDTSRLNEEQGLNLYIWSNYEQKYVQPDTTLDSIHVRETGTFDMTSVDIKKLDFLSNVKTKSNLIEWTYGENTKPEDIEKIELHLAGFADPIEINPLATSYKLEKLQSNSQYHGYIIFYTKDGASKRFVINFITSKGKNDSDKPLNSIIGLTW